MRAGHGQHLGLDVPHHHVSGPAAEEDQPRQHHARDPGQGAWTPAPPLGEHPHRVDADRQERRVGRIAVEPAYPAPGPGLRGDPLHRLVRSADPIEDEQVQPRHGHDHEQHDRQRAALVERVEAPAVEAVEGAIDCGKWPPDEASQHSGSCHRFEHGNR